MKTRAKEVLYIDLFEYNMTFNLINDFKDNTGASLLQVALHVQASVFFGQCI